MADEQVPSGISRRDVLKRGAVAGAMVWAAPAVTSLGSRAFAQDAGSPACVFRVVITNETSGEVVLDQTCSSNDTDCCDCIDAAASDSEVFACILAGACAGSDCVDNT